MRHYKTIFASLAIVILFSATGAFGQTSSFTYQGKLTVGGAARVTNQNSANVTKLRASDGALLGTFAVGSTPTGVAFDGANIWVANFSSNNVIKLPVFP